MSESKSCSVDLVEVAVVHLDRRCLGAGGDALDVLEGEHPVGGGPAGAHPEGPFGVSSSSSPPSSWQEMLVHTFTQ